MREIDRRDHERNRPRTNEFDLAAAAGPQRDLEPGRVLVRHQIGRVAAQVEVRDRIVDVRHLAPRGGRAEDRIDAGGVESSFILHSVSDDPEDPWRRGRIGGERNVFRRHRDGFGELEAEDCGVLLRIGPESVQEDLALQIAVGRRRLRRELGQSVVEKALSVLAPGGGTKLRAIDPVGELLAGGGLDDLQHAVFRAADGDSRGHITAVQRRNEVVDRVMLLLRRELLRIE